MEARPHPLGKLLHGLTWTLILAGLYLASLYSYLLFHSLAELFSIVIAVGVFAIAWNSRRFLENNYLLFLGIAYLFVGLTDLLHTLAYKGMGVFPGYGANLPTQLWIAARYLEGVSLLLAPWFLNRPLHPPAVFAGYFLVFTFLLLAIFSGQAFPVCFVEGVGLTPFKKGSEYVICGLLAGALAFLWRERAEFDRHVFNLIVWSIILTMGSELAFTFYVSVYGLSNFVGHILKILSFYLIYKALIETGLVKPYNLLFRNLKLSEEALRKERDFVDRLIDAAPSIVLVLDQQGRILRFNPYLEEISGFRLAEVQGRDWISTFVPPRDRASLSQLLVKSMGNIGSLGSVYPIATKEGRERRIEWHTRSLEDGRGNLMGLISIGQDITERLEAEEKIRRLNAELELKIGEVTKQRAELEAANRELESFSFSVSHDLRAPLRGISGFGRALEEDYGARLDPQGLDYLHQVQNSARQMAELIDALLGLSRMMQAPMHRTPVDLSALARAVADDLRKSAPDRQVEFVIEPGLAAQGDRAMLRAVLANLLDNAWKFTRKVPQARIEFGSQPQVQGCQVFFVRDNGAGFDPKYAHKLFGAFQRLHSTREFPGTGIGLATVQRLIQRHGGRVWAEGAVNQGATFYFTLEGQPGNEES
jgi:PAS domain S-box-containing protein